LRKAKFYSDVSHYIREELVSLKGDIGMNNRLTRRGLLILCMLAVFGGGNPSAQSSKSAARPGGQKSGAPANPDQPRDESLTVEEYIRLGLAAPDREWSGVDMAEAEKVLASLASKGYGQFPRYQSERSGDVFARMTSPQNLSLFRNRSVPLDARFPLAMEYLRASNQISKLYYAAFLKAAARDSEIVELMGAMFRVTAVMFELVDEFLPTIKKDDPTYQVRMQGLEGMKQALGSVVAGGLLTLTDRRSVRSSELARLVGYMQETFPLIVPQLPPGVRVETLIRLEKLQSDPAMKDLQPDLRELHLKVKSSVPQ
jgi:hypothetical protein